MNNWWRYDHNIYSLSNSLLFQLPYCYYTIGNTTNLLLTQVHSLTIILKSSHFDHHYHYHAWHIWTIWSSFVSSYAHFSHMPTSIFWHCNQPGTGSYHFTLRLLIYPASWSICLESLSTIVHPSPQCQLDISKAQIWT